VREESKRERGRGRGEGREEQKNVRAGGSSQHQAGL